MQVHTPPTPLYLRPFVMDDAPPLAEREKVGLTLRAARKEAKLGTARAAELGGVSVTQLGAIERGAHPLTSMSAVNLARLPGAFGMTWERFVGIVAPVYGAYIPFLRSGHSPITSSSHGQGETLHSPPYTMKPIYDLVQASRPLEDMEPIPDLSPVPVLNEHVRPGLLVFQVRGDSMASGTERGIAEGDTVYVDSHDVTPQPEKVYVIHIPGDGVTLKRVRELGGALWLFSDNPDQRTHPPFQADTARVVGRVYWRVPSGNAV